MDGEERYSGAAGLWRYRYEKQAIASRVMLAAIECGCANPAAIAKLTEAAREHFMMGDDGELMPIGGMNAPGAYRSVEELVREKSPGAVQLTARRGQKGGRPTITRSELLSCDAATLARVGTGALEVVED